DSLCNINSAFGSTQINYKTGQRIGDFLKNESVTSSIIDNEKNLWFTTELNGIYRLYSKGIINWSNKGQLNTKNLIRSVGGIDNMILFGNSTGDFYSIERNQKKLWTKKLFNVNGITGMNQKIKSVNNKLYIFDRMKFYIMDFKNKKNTNDLSTDYFLSIKDFEVMPNEDVYLAFHSGLCFLSYQEFKSANKKRRFIYFYNSRTTSLAKVDSGCYFGTINGLNFFNWDNKITDIAARFPELKVNVSNLFFNDGLLWVGTTDRGLICFDGKKVLKIITIKNGLPENSIRCIYANHDYLWVGTNKGLAEIDLKTSDFKVVKTVSNFEGLVSNIINDVYCYKDTLYAATNEGISIVDVKNLDYFSQCVITDPQIKISGENIKDKKNNLLLKPGQSIGFEFNAISFKSEGGINYYYRLAGLDSNWKIYNRNVIEFLYLPNGSYQFELFAVNRFGAKSKTISIPFAVEKIYYQKTGFIFCMILLLGVLVGLLVYFIVSKQKKSMNQKIFISQKLNKLEQDALKAQMNPHFIFNCLNAIQYFILEKDILSANNFITSFSSIIRHSLDHSSLNQISVKKEIDFLESYLQLEQMRFEDKFTFEIVVGDNIDIENQFIPPMLLQPLIENSINHGILNKQSGMGFIRIEINSQGGLLICRIADNGIGREKAARFISESHQSKGINLIEKRILLLNKSNPDIIGLKFEDILNNENKVSGTMVVLSVIYNSYK
ncbi:MAG: histidine kinase, partial [Bacteroidota bacterium]